MKRYLLLLSSSFYKRYCGAKVEEKEARFKIVSFLLPITCELWIVRRGFRVMIIAIGLDNVAITLGIW